MGLKNARVRYAEMRRDRYLGRGKAAIGGRKSVEKGTDHDMWLRRLNAGLNVVYPPLFIKFPLLAGRSTASDPYQPNNITALRHVSVDAC